MESDFSGVFSSLIFVFYPYFFPFSGFLCTILYYFYIENYNKYNNKEKKEPKNELPLEMKG